MKTSSFFIIVALLAGLSGCSYLGSTFKQVRLSALQKQSPTQRVYKHMLLSDNFFVFGKIKNGSDSNGAVTAVVAVSDQFQKSEVVDVSHFYRNNNSFYGLNLPAGQYQLLVVSDLNHDGFFDEKEVIGGRPLALELEKIPAKVLGDFTIDLDSPFVPPAVLLFHLEVRKSEVAAESLFFPKGSIRSLDDEIFSRRMATLGMYEPAAFLEEAPMMFYALEEDLGYKVPVVFVHGIDGSARDFADIVAKLDRSRYRPWFFFYPSGDDLSKLSEMFYNIFLSGKTMALGNMPMVIVAHSMGGLVVRDALNRQSGRETETKVADLITIASPLGGHPAAAMAAQAPVVIPSWRDVDPGSDFMRGLRRQRLPVDLQYHLIYAFGNETTVKLGENSDGVVPLSSQLCSAAQNESTSQFGFNDTHTGILNNPEAIGRVLASIETVKAPFPDDHMSELLKGGYKVTFDEDYPPIGKYCIVNVGHWLDALATGRIAPLDAMQTHFVRVCQGIESPENPVEKAWLRFIEEYPRRDNL